MEQKSRTRWVWIGGIGAGLAALCCATPILVVLLGVLGLGALSGYLDYVLLPALVVFLGMLVYGLSGPREGTGQSCCADRSGIPPGSDRSAGGTHD
jgi:mercuric ion transport protein